MKFMVIVNEKLMTMVEADSYGAAEHKVLTDIYYGMKTALAFDPATESHLYGWAYNDCKFVSYELLMSEARKYAAKLFEQENDILDGIEEAERKVKDLEEKLFFAKADLECRKDNYRQFQIEHGGEAGYGRKSQKEIDELRKPMMIEAAAC